MKKVLILGAVVALVAAFTVPAEAVDHKFGGMWRTRAISVKNFSGDDTEKKDEQFVDTRTRLYYTAVLNENLKLVNKFEMDATWGLPKKNDTYGGYGADAIAIEIKNTYADFNLGDFNFKVGTQPFKLARGFIWSDDATGVQAVYKGDGFTLPFYWNKGWEGGAGKDANDEDVDFYAIAPSFKAGGFAITANLAYLTSEDYEAFSNPKYVTDTEDLDIYYLGVDVDGKVGPASVWASLIYETGDATEKSTQTEFDIKAYLVAAGATMKTGFGDVHAQAFYASGDDDDADTDFEAFMVPSIQSYTWAEIMGYGEIDYIVTPNSPGRDLTNIIAYNIGVNFKPAPKWNVLLDLWMAKLAEKNPAGDDKLGTEVDLQITYEIMKNFNLDLVAAHLWTGDATYKKVNPGDPKQKDATELAAQLSLKF